MRRCVIGQASAPCIGVTSRASPRRRRLVTGSRACNGTQERGGREALVILPARHPSGSMRGCGRPAPDLDEQLACCESVISVMNSVLTVSAHS